MLDDPIAVAFLDTRPLFPGHVLLVPREHHETLTDLPTELVGPLFERAQRLAGAVQAAMGAAGTFVAHEQHDQPERAAPPRARRAAQPSATGCAGFFWPRTTYRDDAHASEVAAAIRAALASG